MTPPVQPDRRGSSPTVAIKVMQSITGLLSQLIAGGLFIAGGAWIVRYSLQLAAKAHESGKEESYMLTWVGLGVAILGAMFLPTIFDLTKKIYVTFFPAGFPLIGGSRRGDPPVQVFPSETPPDTEIKP